MNIRSAALGSVVTLAVIAGGVTAVAAANAQTDPAPAVVTQTVEEAVPASADTIYVSTIRGLSGVTRATLSDAEIVDGGRKVCTDIDAGATWSQWLVLLSDADLDTAVFRSAIWAAVHTYCPDNYPAMLS